jgi:excisionase family DNA binding protein
MKERLRFPLQLGRYWRARAIAELLDVDVRTVRRWIADGTLPSAKIGGARLVAEAGLLRLLQAD